MKTEKMKQTRATVKGLDKKVDRTYSHEVQVDEEMVVVKTTCKVFGGCFYDENGNLTGDCLKCKQDSEVKSYCMIMTDPEIEMVKDSNGTGTRKIIKRKEGKLSIKDYVGQAITAGCYTRKEIISMFLAEYPENNESQGGRYVSSAFNAKYSIKRWGKIAQKSDGGIVSWK